MITSIYATNNVGAFGNNDGSLPWPKNHEDMKRFSRETKKIGTVFMGNATYNSFQTELPLPDRNAVILAHKMPDGRELEFGEIVRMVVGSHNLIFINNHTQMSIKIAEKMFGDVAVIGGATVLKEALEISDAIHVTILDNNYDADIMETFATPDGLTAWCFEKLPDSSGKTFYMYK